MKSRNTKGKRNRKPLNEWSTLAIQAKGLLRPKIQPKIQEIKRKRHSDRESGFWKNPNSLGLPLSCVLGIKIRY